MGDPSDAAVLSVPGAMWEPDLGMFRALLTTTAETGRGDLAELGVLYGRSAVLIGAHLGEGQTFTVADLFGRDAPDDANAEENMSSYPDLTRAVFEANYLTHHDVLPIVVEGLTSTITEHAAPGTHRFVHVDASHLYEHVSSDIDTARILLAPDGVLVLDDFRAEHTPGVAAAAWQSVVTTGLRPFAVSPFKMYATWGDPGVPQQRVADWAAAAGHEVETQHVNGRPLLRVMSAAEPRHPAKRYVPEVAWPLMARARGWAAAVRRG